MPARRRAKVEAPAGPTTAVTRATGNSQPQRPGDFQHDDESAYNPHFSGGYAAQQEDADEVTNAKHAASDDDEA